MVALRERMQGRYADWREDLPAEPEGPEGQAVPGWRTFFDECPAPDFGAIPEHLELAADALVWPGRRDHPLPGAPAGAHICRTFEGIEPDSVRVVVLGQDPYPSISSATGRAFEDGAWNAGGRPQDLAMSLKPLMLAAWATQPNYAAAFRRGGWSAVIRRPEFTLPNLEAYFNALAGEGVLFVNAAWTHTGPRDVRVHLKVWKPAVAHLLRRLVWRDSSSPIAFLLLGGDARDLFLSAVGRHFRQDVINGATRLATVYCDHPAYQGGGLYFACGNPLTRVSKALLQLGSEPVRWWPFQQAEAEEPA